MIDINEVYTIETWMIGEPLPKNRRNKKKNNNVDIVENENKLNSVFKNAPVPAVKENIKKQSTMDYLKQFTEKMRSNPKPEPASPIDLVKTMEPDNMAEPVNIPEPVSTSEPSIALSETEISKQTSLISDDLWSVLQKINVNNTEKQEERSVFEKPFCASNTPEREPVHLTSYVKPSHYQPPPFAHVSPVPANTNTLPVSSLSHMTLSHSIPHMTHTPSVPSMASTPLNPHTGQPPSHPHWGPPPPSHYIAQSLSNSQSRPPPSNPQMGSLPSQLPINPSPSNPHMGAPHSISHMVPVQSTPHMNTLMGPLTNSSVGLPSTPHIGHPLNSFMGPPSNLQMGPPSNLQMGPPSNLQMGPPSNLQMGPPSNLQMGPPSNLQMGPPSNLQMGPTSNLQMGPPSNLQMGPPSNLQMGPPSNLQMGPPSNLQMGAPSNLQMGAPRSICHMASASHRAQVPSIHHMIPVSLNPHLAPLPSNMLSASSISHIIPTVHEIAPLSTNAHMAASTIHMASVYSLPTGTAPIKNQHIPVPPVTSIPHILPTMSTAAKSDSTLVNVLKDLHSSESVHHKDSHISNSINDKTNIESDVDTPKSGEIQEILQAVCDPRLSKKRDISQNEYQKQPIKQRGLSSNLNLTAMEKAVILCNYGMTTQPNESSTNTLTADYNQASTKSPNKQKVAKQKQKSKKRPSTKEKDKSIENKLVFDDLTDLCDIVMDSDCEDDSKGMECVNIFAEILPESTWLTTGKLM